ncbi:unnamed protein product [Dicrocoelium dendriticum]|nr:unnamed protein product [Dicrocoelium dendriticum]
MSILISMICLGMLLFASGLLCLLFIMYRRRGSEFVQRESKQRSDGPCRSRWARIPAHALFGWIRPNKRRARRRARSAFSFSEMHGPPPGSGSVAVNLPPYADGMMLPYFNEAASTGFGCDSLGSVPRPNGTLGSCTGLVNPVCNTPQFGSLRTDIVRTNELIRVNSTESASGVFYGSQPGALCPIDSSSLGTDRLDSPSLLNGYALHPTYNTGLGSGSMKSAHTPGPNPLSGLGLSCANPMVTGPQSRRTGHSHMIPVDQLVEHVRSLKADNGRLMAAEFESIDPGGQFTWEHSNRAMNRPKNRYANIIAYDHSRVVLQSTSPLDPDSDYINANYLDGYRKQNAYIATQGPLPHTIADFWRMVWDQRSAMIVSMTRLEERARVKCEQYWPTNSSTKTVITTTPNPFTCSKSVNRRHLYLQPDHTTSSAAGKLNGFKMHNEFQDSSMVLAHSMSYQELPDDGGGNRGDACPWIGSGTGLLGEAKYGDITVGVLDVMKLAYYTIRTFLLSKNGSLERREVRQMQFTAWPDHGVPNHPAPLLMFLRRVRAECPPDAGPIIVHCSAGVGRTGAFILLDIILEQMKHEKAVDVHGAVSRLRSQRNFMVQTEDQYAFVYDALVEAASSGNTEVTVRQLAAHWSRLTKSDGVSNVTANKAKMSTGLELEFTQLVSQIQFPKFTSSPPSNVGLLSPIDLLSVHEDSRILNGTSNTPRVPSNGLPYQKMSAANMRINMMMLVFLGSSEYANALIKLLSHSVGIAES